MEEKQLSFGERLVGLSFNPSKDSKVDRAKQLCAELADLINDNYNNPYNYGDKKSSIAPGFDDQLKETLFLHTIGEILNAQMNVVKLLTLKY